MSRSLVIFFLTQKLNAILDEPENSQLWLTSEDPQVLVSKYKEYVHGDSKKERRIVLDQQQMPSVLGSNNLRIVPRRDLLERFLNTVRSEAQKAVVNKATLIILIFGHGNTREEGGVWIGGGNDVLKMKDLRRILPKQSLHYAVHEFMLL